MLVQKYLLGLDQGAVVFEPDGNIPPDFSLGETIGIEVRRLNQNHERPNGSKNGLEEFSIPLLASLKKHLPLIGSSVQGESWLVSIDYQRPIGLSPKSLIAKIKSELTTFMHSSTRTPQTICIGNIELVLDPAGKDLGSFFQYFSSIDDDEGGDIISEIERNLKICIAEKELKIEKYRDKYSKWWLVLPNHIDNSMDLEDYEAFRDTLKPNIQHGFDKIILIDSQDYTCAFEVYP